MREKGNGFPGPEDSALLSSTQAKLYISSKTQQALLPLALHPPLMGEQGNLFSGKLGTKLAPTVTTGRATSPPWKVSSPVSGNKSATES